MAFINNQKFVEIRNAAKNGSEKAKMILQAMLKDASQGDVDRLVSNYYEINEEELPQETAVEPTESVVEPKTQDNEEVTAKVESSKIEPNKPIDITIDLDKEMEDLLDRNNIDDISFFKFLKNKKRDGLRAKKNKDYFKIYDAEGRKNYADSNISKYKDSFNGLLKDIERRYSDNNKALNGYVQGLNDMLDDSVELDTNKVNDAYLAFTGSDEIMHSFGRHWDEGDNKQIMEGLKILMERFGKKNVLAALNTLKSDNDNYKDFMNNKVDTEIYRYSKSIDDLLK